MNRKRARVALLAALVLLAGARGLLPAEGGCAPADLTVGTAAGSPGARVEVAITGGVSCAVTGFSLALGYDGSLLRYSGAEPGDFLVAHAGDQLFFHQEGNDAGGYAAVGAIFDLSFPLTVPPTAIEEGSVLARVAFQVAAGAPLGEVPLRNRTLTYGASGPIANIYSGLPGEPPVEPVLVDGSVTIEPPPPFRRGDANGDGGMDLGDAVAILFELFVAAGGNGCPMAADSNDDGAVDISDAVALLEYLFLDGPAPPGPFSSCGPDPTPDGLPCGEFTGCE